MKKFLLLFIPILSLTILFNIKNANAQVYPTSVVKGEYLSTIKYGDDYNVNTYEYEVAYSVRGDYRNLLSDDDYFLITKHNIVLRKGVNRNTNSYGLKSITYNNTTGNSRIVLTITLLKSFVNDNYSNVPGDENYYTNFFINDSAVYVKQLEGDYGTGYDKGFADGYEQGKQEGIDIGYGQGFNSGYNLGYNAGYDEGYRIGDGAGYNRGYNDGVKITEPEAYKRGFEDGLKSTLAKFTDNFHLWFIPAIILVFVIGIFIAYRKERV